ncbi:MAG: hypothetical protein K6E40_03620 [Desulfovibrio sp.]|nr:hypothetical protein [Desulfovibrio sp.]
MLTRIPVRNTLPGKPRSLVRSATDAMKRRDASVMTPSRDARRPESAVKGLREQRGVA